MSSFIQFFIGVILFFGTWIITIRLVTENITLGLVAGISILWIYISIIEIINDNRLKLSGEYWFALDMDKNGVHIKKKMMKIAKKVERKGLHKLIPNLYYNIILYYPELQKTSNDQIPSFVEAVNMVYEEVQQDKTIKRAIDIVIYGKHYRFIEHTDGLLELFADEKRVFAVNTKQHSLLAFKDGEWIHDFKKFEKNVTLEKKKDAKQEDKEKHSELIKIAKKNFDID